MSKREDKHIFQLQRHGRNNTKATKHDCPNCGRKSFTRYVYFENGKEIEVDDTCGLCDHQSSCGYHLPPRDFYRLHPQKRIDLQSEQGQENHKPVYKPVNSKVDYIDDCNMTRFDSLSNDLILYFYALPQIDRIELLRVLRDYKIGSTYKNETVYWQIDIEGKIRTGKIIPYDKDTGHRIHSQYPVDWVHARLARSYKRRYGESLPDFNLSQCLFGEHLLSRRPADPIGLVESEKTALLCALIWPEYVWLATGGMNNMSPGLLKVLNGRTVVVIPDVDAYENWKGNLGMFPDCKVYLYEGLENNVSENDRKNKIDIGDIIIRYLYGKDSDLNRLKKIDFREKNK